jgi:chromosome segregation ATPase
MRLFKKDSSPFGAEDVKATQDVVQSITAALKMGAEQQDLATRRLAELTKSMNKMDVNVRQTKRLEDEAVRMNAELTTLREDLEKKRAWAQEQSAKLASVQKERDNLRSKLDNTKSELSARAERETGLRESEFQLRKEGESLNKELNQRTSRLEELVLTQQRVQDELAQATGIISSQNHKIRELQNGVDEFTSRLEEKTKAADASLAALRAASS